MSIIYLEPTDAAAVKLNAATFRYSGRTFKAQIHSGPGMSLTSCWDGGSRSQYKVVELATMRQMEIPENGWRRLHAGRGSGSAQWPRVP